ncbi:MULTISPECIES: prepilin-type N-terminal cleavage/methylation domain-containing protein [Providencia]|uniref:prepilin-type N-terminal cleavage/methylation domain-containing protein n=1 Tax=Providencia TaxID=586 RepID=UPI0015EC1F75|nr:MULTISPECIES: prepilin-type N-terminal cleavage/methylation domain-containing protein [Providencia]QLQ91778.1 prepilin-type N-terminal cleavage/methylation domain-containing protein [Providencia rettgeri]WEB82382.1 prepilin-type N-terminal cleavage/methylation domain-containing protein [Providencia rettgeri]HCH7934009.1 prepilin-type N-terminal cleavage/methylation domain-containing protein [Providencia rettgeri]
MKKSKIAGYSLLEVIIVLGIIGVIMVPLSRFIINRIEDNRRQQISDTIVDEIYRFIDFVNSDELETIDGNLKRNPLFQIGNKKPEYSKRVSNYKIEDELTHDNLHFNWGSGIGSERNYFTDETCQGSLLELSLKKEFLKCTIDPLISQQPVLSIERIDLIGDTKRKTIERTDFIAMYHPQKEEENLYVDNLYNNFMQSFKDKSLYLIQADMVFKEKEDNENTNWQLLKRNNKNIKFGELALNADALSNDNYNYGIRFSFNSKAGKYLKSDGSVNTDKLCWNTKNSQYGPCLMAKDENKLVLTSGALDKNEKMPALCWDTQNKAKSVCLELKEVPEDFSITDAQYLDDSNFILTKEDNKGNQVAGTLVANVVIEDSHYEGSKLVKEYRTVPEVSYHSFTGNNKSMIVGENYVGDDLKEDGVITIPRKLCPVVNDVRLWPRLTVAVSSMAPVVFDDEKNILDVDLSHESSTRINKIKHVGLSAGVVLQARHGYVVGTATTPFQPTWIISASLGVNNPENGDSSTYVNPKSLSIMAVEWCSSIKGDYSTSYD